MVVITIQNSKFTFFTTILFYNLIVGRSYADATDERARKDIFARHLKAIAINNYLYSKGLKSFTMGINEFADLVRDAISFSPYQSFDAVTK